MDNNQIAFTHYLQQEKNYSIHTVSAYEKDLNDFSDFLTCNFEHSDLKDVTFNQVRSWTVFLIDKGLIAATVNRKISSLKAFYKFLMKTKQIDVSPLIKNKSLKVGKKVQIPFSEKEVKVVLTEALFEKSFEGVRDRLILDLLYTTGIRRIELIELKISDINIFSSTLKVLGKRNKERIIPVLPEILDQVKWYLKERAGLEVIQNPDLLFLTKSGNKLNISLVYRLVNRYFSGATEKVKKSPHIIRHSFATHLLNNGADINSVKDLLGHATLASTQVYTHNSLSELKKVHATSHPRRKK